VVISASLVNFGKGAAGLVGGTARIL